MSEQKIYDIECPSCHQEFSMEVPIPEVRSGLAPIGNILVYKTNTEMIKQYLTEKLQSFEKNAKLEIVVKYCEKTDTYEKKKKQQFRRKGKHQGYASMIIMFSEEILDKKNSGFYEKLGYSSGSPNIVKTVKAEFIKKFQYDRKELDNILGDYRYLEKLEDEFGMTEAFIEDIRDYSIPIIVPTPDKESWILFSARPEAIIYDMLENPEPYKWIKNPDGGTDIGITKVDGEIEIYEVCPISKGVVEYVIYVHPENMKSNKGNPLIYNMIKGFKK